jgi:hypothetical protein
MEATMLIYIGDLPKELQIKTEEIQKEKQGLWFVFYKDGWKSANYTDKENVHYDAEETKRALLSDIRKAIPCTCNDCKEDGGKQ